MADDPHARDEAPDDLPAGLADAAAEQLLAVNGDQRVAVLAALSAAHAQHASGLRRLADQLAGVDAMLGQSFTRGRREELRQIGDYRVTRKLGEGAFGVVYLCAQQHPIVRDVAIKVLRPGAGDERTLRRFAAELQTLASLSHRSITPVFDAGELPDGRPYFVMEYVDGATILTYCETKDLTCEHRLRLFVQVCRGVAHANARGIVHRDLKPANVLVVDTDDGPLPMIIDFGIAKALAVSETGDGPRTDAGRVIGTPGYMSPEQAAGRGHEVDARADVFSLGVMLYELLTGQLPWAHGAAATDTDPLRPSARVTASTKATADASPATGRTRAAQLRGDLDWITLHALAREREQRYATVNDLLADVERHLRGEAVSVGPPSLRYRLRKFVRRNRASVATIAASLLLLGAGLVAAMLYGSSADCEVAAAKASASASFADAMSFVDLLVQRARDPELVEAPKSDRARQALLQDAVSAYDHLLLSHATDPAVRGRRCKALLDICQVHLQLGETARAGSIAAAAVEESRALLAADGGDDRRALLGESLRQQGKALKLAGNLAAAHALLAAAVEQFAACAATAPEAYGLAYAAVLREDADALAPDQGEASLAGMQRSLEVVEALRHDHAAMAGLVDEHFEACIEVAIKQIALHRFAQAKPMLDDAEADLPQITTDRTQRLLRLRQQQGRCAWWLGDRPQGMRYQQAAVEAAQTWVQEQPLRLQPQESLARALCDLGISQNYAGAFADSNAALRRAVLQAEAMVQRFPEDPSRLASLCRFQRLFAQTLWERYRLEDLEEAAAVAAAATDTNDRIAADVGADRQPRWLLSALEAGIAEARGEDASRWWQQVAVDVPDDAQARARLDARTLAMACAGLANWHCHGGRAEACRVWLGRTREAIARSDSLADKLLVDLGWIEAQLAQRTGDHAAAAAAADRVLAARKTWFAHQRAGDCLFAAWRCAAAAATPDASTVHGYQQRAIANYRTVLDNLRGDVGEPLDPWYVLPWGFCSIREAQLTASAGDAKGATELLTAALPKLEAVQANACVDQWDAPAFAEGRALLAQLQASAEHH